jgi:signal transduction histidine kinase
VIERRGLNWPRQWRSLPPRAQDAVIALATFAGCALLTFVDTGTFVGTDGGPSWVRLLLIAGCCALQLLRRSRAVTGLLVGAALVGVDALLGLTLPIVLAFTDLIYAAALYSSARQSRLVVRGFALAAAVIGVVTAFVSVEVRTTVLVLLIVAALVASPLQTALAVRHHRDRAAWERERAEADRVLAQLNHAAELDAERAAMARELHDVISGQLSAIALQSEALLRAEKIGSIAPVRRAEAVGAIRQQSLQGLSSMRTMIDMLRSRRDATSDLDELPVTLSGSLHLLRSLADGAGSTLDIGLMPERMPPLPSAIDLACYRIVLEALTNAVKHAPGAPIMLRVEVTDTAVRLAVCNTGGRGDPGTTVGGTGNGLTNMLYRVSALGGRFEAGPIDPGAPGGGPDPTGWAVRATIPLSVEPESVKAVQVR